ncbi:3-oxoacyl-ACP synthase III family protein [Streptomyces sp. 6N223]|uniref:3-oxoacyl-ACP synthase III family protein n=1 Tax=Streptomyces sp. 6N223 TaxID=3457412 RepID=UPI003FCF3106
MPPSPGGPPLRARLAATAVHLPPRHRTMAQTRQRLIDLGSPYVPPPGLLEELTGVRRVHERDDGQQASDLAVEACGKALAAADAGIEDVDLLLFASSSQDLIEPATGHVVAAKLGAACPVFDVKNACNSVLNAAEVASGFIESGRHRTVLIACGEAGTLMTRWHVPDEEEFTRCLPGYTVSDAGAALLLTAGPAGEHDPGVLHLAFGSDSTAWEACTIAAGGTLHGRRNDWEVSSLRLGGNQLRDAALGGLPLVLDHTDVLERVRASDFIAVHQISRPAFDELVAALELPPERCLPTIVEHGNAASASLPLQLVTARESGLVEPGDTVALIGLASGFSVGLALIRL